MTRTPQVTPPEDASDRAWSAGQGVRIGVIDSGCDRGRHDARFAPGVAFVGGADELTLLRGEDDHDRIGHGTVCADIIHRIAPAATIVPIRVFGARLETSPDILVAAIDWGVEHRLPLLNLSLATGRRDAVVGLYRACERARRSGTIVVASGANGSEGRSFPAEFDCVIGVGTSSDLGPNEMRYVPGDALECRASGTQWARGLRGVSGTWGGTSVAAPVVTGHIATFLHELSNASPEAVRSHLAARYARPDVAATRASRR